MDKYTIFFNYNFKLFLINIYHLLEPELEPVLELVFELALEPVLEPVFVLVFFGTHNLTLEFPGHWLLYLI